MSIEDADDLAAFFDADEFGAPAVYRAGGTGEPRDVAGLFDAGHAAVGLGPLTGEGREITFRCTAADIPLAQQGDTLRVGSTTYRVRSARPDGTGVVILILAT